jgi:hypothetical protein
MDMQPGQSHGSDEQPPAQIFDLGEVRAQKENSALVRLRGLLEAHPEIQLDANGMPTLDRWPVSNSAIMEITLALDEYKRTIPEGEAESPAA